LAKKGKGGVAIPINFVSTLSIQLELSYRVPKSTCKRRKKVGKYKK
jgi:hypothetical protein